MTVKELKSLIADLPNDWPVKGFCAMEGVFCTEDSPRVTIGNDALWLDVEDAFSRRME